jgi:DNA modification methylase
MVNIEQIIRGFKTPEARWARFGPYYAMFPLDFAFDVIQKYSKKGDFVIDPFAGRCSSIYAGGILGRPSLGIEINPVGWLYGAVKLKPADKEEVKDRLLEIYHKRNYYKQSLDKMHPFYRICYCDEVLKFLLCARQHLKWRTDSVDATLMSILLVYLHGNIGESLSNQMKISKSMGLYYSIDWWKKKKLQIPPEMDPAEFLIKKIDWRYAKGVPKVVDSEVYFGDSAIALNKIAKRLEETGVEFSLLFTSPPYYSVTNYYADQWLRLWMLGHEETPTYSKGTNKNRFASKEGYYNLLNAVFGTCAGMMAKKSVIYVRTDRRKFTFNLTLEVLKYHFPKYKLQIHDKPFEKRTQTEIHGNRSHGSGEIDIILQRS